MRSLDPCSKIELVRSDAFRVGNPPLPPRLLRLARTIAEHAGVPLPLTVSVHLKCESTFGGRFLADPLGERDGRVGIAVVMHPDPEITRATVVHEMGHVLRYHEAGDHLGHHDREFQRVVGYLYRRYKVSSTVAATVDGRA